MNFLRTLSNPVVQGKLTIPDIHEGIQIFIDLNLASSIINHALGSRDLEPISRGLTEAERAVLETAVNAYLPHYVAAFAGVIESPSFNVTGSPEVTLDPSINTSSTFVAFSAEAALNENPPGKIIFGYPGSTLKNIISRRMEKEIDKPLDFSRLSPAALSRITAPVTAILGKTSLLTTELHNLEAGDVVSLDTPISSALALAIGNFLKLMIQPGTMNKKKAARIAGFKEEELQITPPVAVEEGKEKAKPAEAPKAAETVKEKEELPEEELIEEEFPEDEFLEDDEFSEEDFLNEEEGEEKEA
jgi:flagellar motor switch protein FliM